MPLPTVLILVRLIEASLLTLDLVILFNLLKIAMRILFFSLLFLFFLALSSCYSSKVSIFPSFGHLIRDTSTVLIKGVKPDAKFDHYITHSVIKSLEDCDFGKLNYDQYDSIFQSHFINSKHKIIPSQDDFKKIGELFQNIDYYLVIGFGSDFQEPGIALGQPDIYDKTYHPEKDDAWETFYFKLFDIKNAHEVLRTTVKTNTSPPDLSEGNKAEDRKYNIIVTIISIPIQIIHQIFLPSKVYNKTIKKFKKVCFCGKWKSDLY